MNMRIHHSERRFALCTMLLVAFFLAACSTGGSGASATPTAASKPTPTPSPTTSSSIALKTYTGMGFTIEYPSNWTVGTSGNGSSGGGAIFSDSPAMTAFYIETILNPNGVASPAGVVKTGMSTALQAMGGKHMKTVSIAPTAMVGGQTWNQAAGTGEHTQGGQTVTLQLVMMATNHPASSPSTKLFIITYVSPAQTFDQTNMTTFQPMLQSFKFTS